MDSAVIVFVIAWLVLALIGELVADAAVAKILRVVTIIVALLLILWDVGAIHWR